MWFTNVLRKTSISLNINKKGSAFSLVTSTQSGCLVSSLQLSWTHVVLLHSVYVWDYWKCLCWCLIHDLSMTPLVKSPTHQLWIQNTRASCSLSRQLCSHYCFIFSRLLPLCCFVQTYEQLGFRLFAPTVYPVYNLSYESLMICVVPGFYWVKIQFPTSGKWKNVNNWCVSHVWGQQWNGARSWLSLKVYNPAGDKGDFVIKDPFRGGSLV